MPFLSPRALASACPSVMPMSSPVWCASISRSPRARTVRSMAPWRATWSSMWSRKGMPEASSARPVPSRSTATKTCVSFVSRWTSALRMVGLEDRGEGLEESGIFFGGADRKSQRVREERMGAVEGPDQYTTLLQGLVRAGAVGNADQDEVGRGGKARDAADAVEAALEHGTLVHDGAGLRVQHVALLEQE